MGFTMNFQMVPLVNGIIAQRTTELVPSAVLFFMLCDIVPICRSVVTTSAFKNKFFFFLKSLHLNQNRYWFIVNYENVLKEIKIITFDLMPRLKRWLAFPEDGRFAIDDPPIDSTEEIRSFDGNGEFRAYGGIFGYWLIGKWWYYYGSYSKPIKENNHLYFVS